MFLVRLPNRHPVELLAYHNIAETKQSDLDRAYDLPDLLPPDYERMQELVAILGGFGLEVKIQAE